VSLLNGVDGPADRIVIADRCEGRDPPSAVIAGLTAGMLPIRFLGDFHLDCRKPFNPRKQVIRAHKCAATTFDGAQLARLNRLIECGPAGARHSARLGDGVLSAV